MNVILVDAFKEVYKKLDVEKKGYIKLKDLVNYLVNFIESNSLSNRRRGT